MRDEIKRIEEAALQEIGCAAADKETLENLRIKYLGRKGVITELFKKMAEFSPSEKPEAGKLLNVLKNNLTCALDEKARAVSSGEAEGPALDVTLPGTLPAIGHTTLFRLSSLTDQDRYPAKHCVWRGCFIFQKA